MIFGHRGKFPCFWAEIRSFKGNFGLSQTRAPVPLCPGPTVRQPGKKHRLNKAGWFSARLTVRCSRLGLLPVCRPGGPSASYSPAGCRSAVIGSSSAECAKCFERALGPESVFCLSGGTFAKCAKSAKCLAVRLAKKGSFLPFRGAQKNILWCARMSKHFAHFAERQKTPFSSRAHGQTLRRLRTLRRNQQKTPFAGSGLTSPEP